MKMMKNKVITILFFFVFVTGCAIFNKMSGASIKTNTALETLETARFFLKADKFKKAIEYYDLILIKFPEEHRENAWALYEKAFCLYKLKRYEEARQSFLNVIRRFPEETGPVIMAEKMLSQLNKFIRN